MVNNYFNRWRGMTMAAGALLLAGRGLGQEAALPAPGATGGPTNNLALSEVKEQTWNWHMQNTEVVQSSPGFPAKYTNPGFNSLPTGGETRETVSLDLMAGVRLWQGAEAHIDGLMWQGFGLNNTLGLEAVPNGEAYRLGTALPNGMFSRLFI
ncbi:MAG: hypothetical protein ABSG04_05680, partial [Verrucomicrobiota bacterium]